MWLGTDWEGRRAYQNFIDAQYGVEVAAVGRRAIRTGYGSSWSNGYGNSNQTMVQIAGGLQYAQQERVTGSTFQCDHSVANYSVELAVASGGCTVTLPDLPYLREANAAPPVVGGRTLVFADVLGSLSVGNSLTLTDGARTFNGAAGPFVVTDPYSVCTVTLDSTTNNWIVSAAVPSPSSGSGGGSGPSYFNSSVTGSVYTSGSVAFVGGFDEYGVVTSPSDKGSDVFFYVSGSAGSAGTSTQGVALFGGDVVISGSSYITGDEIDIYGTLRVSGTTAFDSEMNPISSLGSDVFFYVSGSAGSAGTSNRGSAMFGGDLVVSGTAELHGAVLYGASLEVSSTLFVSGPISFDSEMRSCSTLGSDVFFFVSGSKNSRGSSTPAVTLLGGDLVTSGSIVSLSGLSGSFSGTMSWSTRSFSGAGPFTAPLTGFVLVEPAASVTVLNLPSGAPDGFQTVVKRRDSVPNAYVLEVSGSGGDTIDDALGTKISTNYGSMSFIKLGGGWYIT
ncbi:MAG: hypothetical protein EBR82_00330 [Caulobacteraceae bacterium]|nr:hypothetical protein [Caulobacteraceae bacterium]